VAETPPGNDPTTTVSSSDSQALSTPNRKRQRHYRKPVNCWDVYVDDFIGLVQGNRWQRQKVKRVLLDKVLRQLDNSNNPHLQEPASIKKMLKGDATWTMRKLILGWIINTIRLTIELPPHRLERLHQLLDSIKPKQCRISTKQWHKVLGELCSMLIAIPGGKGLFSTLQEAFKDPEHHGRRL